MIFSHYSESGRPQIDFPGCGFTITAGTDYGNQSESTLAARSGNITTKARMLRQCCVPLMQELHTVARIKRACTLFFNALDVFEEVMDLTRRRVFSPSLVSFANNT